MPTRTITVPDTVNGASAWVAMAGLESKVRTFQLYGEAGGAFAIEFSNDGVHEAPFVTLYGDKDSTTTEHAGQFYRVVRKAGAGSGAVVLVSADETMDGASGIRSGLLSVSAVDLMALAVDVTDFELLVDPILPDGARFVGARVEAIDQFIVPGPATVDLKLGTPGQDCYVVDHLNDPAPSPALNPAEIFALIPGAFGLRLTTTAPALNLVSAGQITIRYFYSVPISS